MNIKIFIKIFIYLDVYILAKQSMNIVKSYAIMENFDNVHVHYKPSQKNGKQLRHETIAIVKQSHKLYVINEVANITSIDMHDLTLSNSL